MDTSDHTMPATQGLLRVLMISLDPGLLDAHAGTGDALARHTLYASQVASLDIVVLGGKSPDTKNYGTLTIHSTGAKGFSGLTRGVALARRIALERKVGLIVTQDPHATGWIGAKLKRELRIPLLVDMHGDFWNNRAWLGESWKHYVYASIQRKIVHAASRIRVVSYGIEAKLLAAGIPQDKIVVIPTPVNTTVFQNLDEHQKVLLEELRFKYQGKKIIVFCGRLVAAKNLHFLLDVADDLQKRRDDWILLIIGSGEEQSSLELQIKKLHVASHVQLLGSKPPLELAGYYQAALVMVLPSTNESFGKVIIEAGITGTPTLATETTGAKHIISDGRTGFLVPLNDRQAFLDVLDEMLEFPDQTKQLGEWAREQYLQQYAQGPTIQHIIALWQETARL